MWVSDLRRPCEGCHQLRHHEDGQCQNEGKEMFIVPAANASSDPRTMVIESLHTVVTIATVMGPVGSYDETLLTETVW